MKMLARVLLLVSVAHAMHMAILTPSQTSHILHSQGIIEAALRRGHLVTVLTMQGKEKLVRAHANVSVIAAVCTHGDEAYYNYAHSLFDLTGLAIDYSNDGIPAWEEALRRNLPDVLLYDAIFPAGPYLAAKLSIQPVAVGFGVPSLLLNGQEADTSPNIIAHLAEKDIQTSLGARFKNWFFIQMCRFVIPQIQRFFLRNFPRYQSNATTMVLLGSAPGIAPLLLPQTELVISTGPFYPRIGVLDARIETFADRGPFVYISLGTNAEWDSLVASSFALAVNSLPNFNFIWSMKQYQQEKCFPSSRKFQKNVLLVPFVDQFALLQHKNIILFVTRAGYSSMQEAIYHRVPMLAMPGMLDTDQPTNAYRIESLGLGRELKRGAGAYFQAVRDAIVNFNETSLPEMHFNLDRWSRIMRSYGGAERAMNIVESVADIGVEHLRRPDSFLDCYAGSFFGLFLLLILLYLILRTAAKCCCSRKTKVKQY